MSCLSVSDSISLSRAPPWDELFQTEAAFEPRQRRIEAANSRCQAGSRNCNLNTSEAFELISATATKRQPLRNGVARLAGYVGSRDQTDGGIARDEPTHHIDPQITLTHTNIETKKEEIMKTTSRRITSIVLITMALLGVMSAGGGVAAAAKGQPAANAYAGSNWHYTLSFAKATGLWDAKLMQSANGNLTGTVDPPTGDCLANVFSGRVSGRTVKMTWKIGAPCRAETVSVTGTIAGSHISGTVKDSLRGAGRFTAIRDY